MINFIKRSYSAFKIKNASGTVISPATEAKQDTIIVDTGVIKGDTTSIDGKITACDTGAVVVATSALPSGASTSAKQLADDHNVTVSNMIAEVETGLATLVKQNENIFHNSKGVPASYTKQSANSEDYLINIGQLTKLRLRPRILNEQVESSKTIQGTVTSTNIVGQIFKASQNNINGIHLAIESAASTVFDDFEYANDGALQTAWVTSGASPATDPTLETTIVDVGSKSMKLPMDALANEWIRTVASTDYSGYTGHIHVYQEKEYNKCKLRFFVGDGTNTASLPLLAIQKNLWYELDISMDALTDDQAGVTDLTAITKIGFRVEDKEGGKNVYIDHMVAIAGGGSFNVKLFDMGATIPISGTSELFDATQYTTLGDLGITGQQVSEIEVSLLGGLRIYPIKEFVAGAAIDVTGNELITIDNYYAITINYIDTNLSVYGSDNCGVGETCYNNGFAFNSADELTGTTIIEIGTYNNLNFAIFSVQDVYLINMRFFANAVPGTTSDSAHFSFYTKTKDFKRFNTIIASANARQTFQASDLKEMPPFLEKGGMLKGEYNDDYSDDVTSVNLGMRYLYIPPTVNG